MNKIGTTRFGCGCTVHTDLDVNGITPWLEHCALHGAALNLRAFVVDLAAALDAHPGRTRDDESLLDEAHAAISRADGAV
jgi:hypothetical protein